MQAIKEQLNQLLSDASLSESRLYGKLRELLYAYEAAQYDVKKSTNLSTLLKSPDLSFFEGEYREGMLDTGFPSFDKEIGGFYKDELVVLGSRPGMGKTQLLINLALHMSVKAPILFFSFDMSASLLAKRFVSSCADVPLRSLLEGRITAAQQESVQQAAEQLKRQRVIINDSSRLSISMLRDVCEKHCQEDGVRVVMVDYMQLMRSGRYRYNREMEMSMIARELKAIARDHQVCLIAASQLSRSVEQRTGDKTPQLSDLRDSGAIEEVADKVLFIHSPEYYGITEDAEGNSLIGVVDLIMAKNSKGKTNTVRLRSSPLRNNFTEVMPAEDFTINFYRQDEIADKPF